MDLSSPMVLFGEGQDRILCGNTQHKPPETCWEACGGYVECQLGGIVKY